MKIFLSQKKSVGVWVDELSQIWISDSDWAGGKEWGAVRVTIDLDVHMGVPEWPHKLLDLKKVVQNDPKVTKKCKKWPPTRKKWQIPQNSNLKALLCSRTHTKTYSKVDSSIGRFCRVVGTQNTQILTRKSSKKTPILEKLRKWKMKMNKILHSI